MIKAKPKPLEEITGCIAHYRNILIAGCGGCVSVCLAGGEKEVHILAAEIEFFLRNAGAPARTIRGFTTERQCNKAYLGDLDALAERSDCMISIACGAGAQLLAERYPKTPVFPGVNTVAIGVDRDIGLYEENCRACGDCVLTYTGGICPVTRCAKGLFNGPCGGTQGESCEVSPEIPCAWLAIFERLKAQNRLEDILKFREPMQWRNQVQRTVVQKGYENRYKREK
jgi:ferredoxin